VDRYLKKLFTAVGKPFYKVLSLIIIGLLIIISTLAKLIKFLYLSITQVFVDGLAQTREAIKKTRLPVLKVKLKIIPLRKIAFPKILLVPLGITALSAFFFWFLILKDLPSPNDLTNRSLPVSTKIYDRNGKLLYTLYKDQNRTPIKLDDVPLHVQLATLAAEDAEFYHHPGFSIRGITRAIIKNLKEGKLTGGSTITQQLVKNALLTPEKTLIRKLKEIVLSVEVEITFTKDEILEMYLNEVAYGGTAYGIQEASRVYFNKNVDQLTLSEAALLAGLPKSPTKYSPFGSNPEAARTRREEVLHLMMVNKFITAEIEKEAIGEEIKLTENKTQILAPHFVMYIREILAEKYGEEVVETGGLEVITTLDWEIQALAEKAIQEEIAKLAPLHVTNGAALVINPKTGEILAMVGSKNYFDTQADGNVNVTVRPRQPGSSIKVINYAWALSNGYAPATILKDTPVTYNITGQPPYSPKNYDNQYRGFLSLRSALAESRNVPAVKVLASYGVDKMIEEGQKLGITTWDNPERFGLSLTLGGGEIKLLDLARVYATLANYGARPELAAIKKVTNYQSKVLEKNGAEIKQVLDKRVAFMLTDILKDNTARTPAFGSQSALVIANHPEVAVKTGTSNNLRDNLTFGYNQDYLVAVWVGNNDNSPMARVASGVTGASPIFNKIMTALLANRQNHDWEVPYC
jgi:1A family penicillin-binding protein